MAASLSRLSRWLWRKKEKEVAANESTALNSSTERDLGFREPEGQKFPASRGARLASSSRKVKKKWQSREEMLIDREFDVVLVPSDGLCLSGSESDDSDLSIGWSEPHGSAVQTDEDDESDNSFAVLVPCYRRGFKEAAESPDSELLSAIRNLPHQFQTEGGKNMDEWLSSLRKIRGSR